MTETKQGTRQAGRGEACVQVLHRGPDLVTGGGRPDPGQENGDQKNDFLDWTIESGVNCCGKW